jgi:hypothetical protein
VVRLVLVCTVGMGWSAGSGELWCAAFLTRCWRSRKAAGLACTAFATRTASAVPATAPTSAAAAAPLAALAALSTLAAFSTLDAVARDLTLLLSIRFTTGT